MRRHWRLLLPLALLAVAIVLVIWRGPDWGLVHDAFSAVTWEWVAAAIGLNLLSVLTRAFAWDTAIKQSIAPPHPRFPNAPIRRSRRASPRRFARALRPRAVRGAPALRAGRAFACAV